MQQGLNLLGCTLLPFVWAGCVVYLVFCFICFLSLLFTWVKKLPGNCTATSEVLLSSPGCQLETLNVEMLKEEAEVSIPRLNHVFSFMTCSLSCC